MKWHPTDASQCLIDISMPVAKLSVDTPAMRRAVGYDSELTDSASCRKRRATVSSGSGPGRRTFRATVRLMAARGGRYVRDRYSWPAIVRAYDEFLTEQVDGLPRPPQPAEWRRG